MERFGSFLMNRSCIRIVVSAVVALACTVSASAVEVIQRKRDKNVTGDVTGVSAIEVTVKVKTQREETIKVPANDISTIIWSGEPPELNVARNDENGGRLQKALDGYVKSQSTKSTNQFLKNDIEYFIVRTTAKMALGDAEKTEDSIRKLEGMKSKLSDHYRYYESMALLGQLYASKKDYVKAQVVYGTVGKAPWKDYQMLSKNSIARILLAEGKGDEAAAAFDSVIAMTAENPSEETQRLAAMLGKVRIVMDQKNHDEALKLLDEIIAKAPPEDARVQAEAYVRQGDCFRSQGKDKDALLAYLHVEVLFSSERDAHAEALFHLSRLWEKIGQKGRAIEARDRLEADFPNSEWTRQLKAPASS
jgi:tetratricopeptide (TPR) repeat protein